jgi:hypothetical protein
MKTTTFENAKPGDRVWDIRKGWGTIDRINSRSTYLITVVPDLDAHAELTYTVEGKSFISDINPSLFWNEVKIEAPEKPPKTKLIHGVEVPDISFEPEKDDNYFYPNPDIFDLYSNTFYSNGSNTDNHRSKNGLCYPFTVEGKLAAILHAKAMLGIKE